jgi:hypothetical protein
VNRARLAGYCVGGALALGAGLGVALVVSSSGDDPSAAPSAAVAAGDGAPLALQRPTVSNNGLEESIGIRIQRVTMTGGGGLIDLRFQVIEPSKAAGVHDTATPPTIVDESSGLVVDQLLMNHAHSGTFAAGRSYYLVFENPGNLIHQGSTVSVLLGNSQLEHVVVG